MDIFMGNLARQAVALPKRLTPTHLSQTFTTRCQDISAVSAVSAPARGGLHVHLPVPQPSVEIPTPDPAEMCQGCQGSSYMGVVHG